MANNTVNEYAALYEHPADLDLWSAGISETPVLGQAKMADNFWSLPVIKEEETDEKSRRLLNDDETICRITHVEKTMQNSLFLS